MIIDGRKPDPSRKRFGTESQGGWICRVVLQGSIEMLISDERYSSTTALILCLIGLGSPMMRLSMKNRMTNGGFIAQTDLQVISKLHMILRPFLLRRVKENVEQNLPKKKEIILYANMTEHQKNIQNHLINKTLEGYLIEKAFHAKGFRAKLSNLMIQLRKNCNHPDLLESAFDNDGLKQRIGKDHSILWFVDSLLSLVIILHGVGGVKPDCNVLLFPSPLARGR
ncbi:putative DNA helicase ino80 [Amborella trichopoda]|uniref:putative DNA helicase ino80 n=1 Tax=Amborella trichopoda TaxID=13333 RepID=UPI0009BEDB1D|nr:putative DNA helicase ino80 [Amborella trichopoda]|eukprot:XP_020531631.1 putative DNA helicase ino80 [Amborella trichopoda]